MNSQATDIHARGAFDGTSWSPEKREEQAAQSYLLHMEQVEHTFAKWRTADNAALLDADLEAYRARYASMYNAYLAAHSRVVSTFITGGSGWTSSRIRTNEKRNNSTDKRSLELQEYSEKQLKRLRLRYDPNLIARRPISSDDPDAIERLEEKIERLEQNQEMMRECNKVVRQKVSGDEKVQQIMEITGVKDTTARKLLQPDFCGRIGFPAYELTNNGANIRRLQERLEELRKRAEVRATLEGGTDTSAAKEEQHGDITYRENLDLNRVQLVFPGKPSEQVRGTLKSHGFKWAPSEGAWQRQLNNAGIWAAKYVLEQIGAQKS